MNDPDRPFIPVASLEEVRRRSADYDAGGVQPIPWAEGKERARRRVALTRGRVRATPNRVRRG